MPPGKAPGFPAFTYARAMLVVACLWFAQLYATLRQPYLHLAQYAAGHERMPFQGRDLMRWPLLAARHSSFLQRITAGRALLRSPELFTTEVIAAVSLFLAGLAAVKLYKLAVSDQAAVPELPFALLIVICYFDFISTVPYTFPYDLPSTAFIGWGTYFAMRRRFLPLLIVFAFGTWNRETTLFLIGVLLVSAATKGGKLAWGRLRTQDFVEIGTLSALWIVILALQKHAYAHNPTEAGSRIASNLRTLANPLLWPNILSASAFLLPWIYLHRGRIAYAPLRSTLLLLPFWVLLLLSFGQILELRIYGDISVPVAVAAALILTQTAAAPGSPTATALAAGKSVSAYTS